jgi:hypothetical protein
MVIRRISFESPSPLMGRTAHRYSVVAVRYSKWHVEELVQNKKKHYEVVTKS